MDYNLAEISERIFQKFGMDEGLILICSLSLSELAKML